MTFIEELKTLIEGSQGTTLTSVIHPSDITTVEVVHMGRGEWYDSVLKSDRDMVGDEKISVVKGRLTIVKHFDEFMEEIGHPRLTMETKYTAPKRPSKDISTTAVKADTIRKLRLRFPKAFSAYETESAARGIPLPIAFLTAKWDYIADDNTLVGDVSVPSDVIMIIASMDTRTIQEFAEWSDEKLLLLAHELKKLNNNSRIPNLQEYRERARRAVGLNVDATPAPKTRAKAH